MIEYFVSFMDGTPGGLAFGLVVLVLLFCGVGFPLPEEFPLFFAGYLVHQGVVSLGTCIIVTMLAILGGDSLLFWIGWKFGNRVFDIPLLRKLLTAERMKKVNEYFHRYGNRVVFLGRFMAGVRSTFFATAGILRMPYRRFILFDGLAALISVPLIVWIAYRVGDHVDEGLKLVRETGWTLFGLVGVPTIGISILVFRIRRRRRKEAQQLLSSGRS